MNILYFASGIPVKCRRALSTLQHRFPHAQIDIVVCPEFEDYLRPDEVPNVIYRAGIDKERIEFLRTTRGRHYDIVVVLFGGDRGYETLKAAAFAVQFPRRLICMNEADGAFEWGWRSRTSIVRHLRWRYALTPRRLVPGLFHLILRFFHLTLGETLGLLCLCMMTIGLVLRRYPRIPPRWYTSAPHTKYKCDVTGELIHRT